MGNCLPKKPPAAANPPATVHLRGPPASPAVSLIRVALYYKSVAVQLLPTPEGPLALHCGADVVRGPVGGILRYLDEKLPGPAVLWAEEGGSSASAAVALQHRSMERQVERMAGEVEAAETRRLARSYGQLAELLLEHARMEETVLFPLLDSSSSPPHHRPGFCRRANEQHARDLPIINGIKEAIKSILVLEAGTDDHQEALLNLSRRLNTLLVHCREHFAEEERDLLPLLEAAERRSGGANSELQLVDRIILGESMEGTHSHLFHLLLSSLLPREAMQYLALVCRCHDQDRVAKMLVTLAAKMELPAAAGTSTPSWPRSYRGSHQRQVANG